MSEELRLKLKAARAKLGLSQSQAANEWGIPLRTLINWENDRRTPRGLALATINKLLDAILAAPLAKAAPKKKK
jgi:DNA-binding transcriptional regulator YiaG